MYEIDSEEVDISQHIAVIGMAGRFPQASDLSQFWQNLCHGVESISFFNEQKLIELGVAKSLRENPDFVPAAAILEDHDQFDADYFGFSPAEAQVMDPQQRVLLECAQTALDDAGYPAGYRGGLVSVFVGVTRSSYLLRNLAPNPSVAQRLGNLQLIIGTDKSFCATQIAYKLDLNGPAVAVDTACSTSLVAIHQACQSLLAFESDIALAGGSSVATPCQSGHLYQLGGIFSPDGHCRPFDDCAKGTVKGSGAGIVVLKRLEDAIEDGDQIDAVVLGSAINNDGADKVGYTAPSVNGQASVITTAHINANIEASSIGYIEAHGTATTLGDPIEIAALTEAFQQTCDGVGYCAIGSVKSNIGHLDAAAGVAGFIKAVMALKYAKIPPSLHYVAPNPEIDFVNSPFYVNHQLSDWPKVGDVRRAGVSAFGIGGTNAHVVLEQAPALAPTEMSDKSWQLLPISTKTQNNLQASCNNIASHLKRNETQLGDIADVAYTLQVGRQNLTHRCCFVVNNFTDSYKVMEERPQGRYFASKREYKDTGVVFMFPGQGSQHVGMGLCLYQHEPYFRQIIDDCASYLEPKLGVDLRQLLYCAPELVDANTQRLQQTSMAQPALFCVEYATAKLWLHWGIKPQTMIGHSLGEIVAACVAGVFSLEDGLDMVAHRGLLMQQLDTGAMIAVPLPVSVVRRQLVKDCDIAAVNGPSLTVVSGSFAAIEAMENQLASKDVSSKRLRTSHAFHSMMMEPMLAQFKQWLGKIEFHPPQMKFISNLTGKTIKAQQVQSPQYWCDHLRQAVLFTAGLSELMSHDNLILLEVGPGNTLGALAKQHRELKPLAVLPSMSRDNGHQEKQLVTIQTLAQMWTLGVNVDWFGVHNHQVRQRQRLPSYPFERKRFWIAAPDQQKKPALDAPSQKTNPYRWSYEPSWQRNNLAFNDRSQLNYASWLIISDGGPLAESLSASLLKSEHQLIHVKIGSAFCQLSETEFEIDINNAGDHHQLVEALALLTNEKVNIIHCLTRHFDEPEECSFAQIQQYGLYSIHHLCRALSSCAPTVRFQLAIVCRDVYNVNGTETLNPSAATVVALARVIPQEYQNIRCMTVDIGTDNEPSLIAQQLLFEFEADCADKALAYRGRQRWAQSFIPAPLGPLVDSQHQLRQDGVYVFTGGVGKIGLSLAGALTKNQRIKLALIGRRDFPPKSSWQGIVDHNTEVNTAELAIIEKLLEMEHNGSEVIKIQADVSDKTQMEAAFVEIEQQLGPVNGVFHLAANVEPQNFGLIETIDIEHYEAHFKPKVMGSNILDLLLADRNVDFCLLFSSLASILGGIGYAPYAAANAYMDAFAQRKHVHNSNTRWISVNLDAWIDPNTKSHFDSKNKSTQQNTGMEPEQGVKLLRRVVEHCFGPQVVISVDDLDERLAHWVDITPSWQQGELDDKQSDVEHNRPNLDNEYVEPEDEIEIAIAAIFADLLGVDRIGANDSFLELGGHSLLATQIITQIRQEFGISLSLPTFFNAATVAGLAEVVIEQALANTDDEALVAAMEGLDDDDDLAFEETVDE